jgi:TonB family protein
MSARGRQISLDVIGVREVARAAGVPAGDLFEIAERRRLWMVRGCLRWRDAVRIVRELRTSLKLSGNGRTPLTVPNETRRRAGLPLAVSGALHAIGLALLLLITSLGILGARDTENTVKTPDPPVRLVFLLDPGPGGGGGGGGLLTPQPPARAAQQAPVIHKISSPVPKHRAPAPPQPELEPPKPPPPPTPPPPLPMKVEAPKLDPSKILPTRAPPPPAVQAPVASVPADSATRAGVPAAKATAPSAGPGTGGGVGTGKGTGIGEGSGSGLGPGSGGGTGGGPYLPGNGIEPPTLVREVKPLYTDEARRRAVEGDVMLEVVVRRDGTVGNPRVTRGLGSGLDERALDAVRQWRFNPARRQGTPVDVIVQIAVEFKLR